MAVIDVLSKEFSIIIGTKTVAYATDFTLEVGKEIIDITKLGDLWKRKKVDLSSFKVSTNGLITRGVSTDMEYENLLTEAHDSNSTVLVTIKPAGSGRIYYYGNGFLTGLNASFKTGDKTVFSASFESDGELQSGTNP